MPLTQEQIQKLNEGLERGEAQAWKWDEDGHKILGTVRRLERIQTKDYGEALTLIVEVDGEERRVLCTTVLQSKLQRLNVRAGEAIGIERAAEKTRPASGGAGYWDYHVFTLPDDQAPALKWSTTEALPAAESVVDAEVVDNEYAYDAPYETPHLPRKQVASKRQRTRGRSRPLGRTSVADALARLGTPADVLRRHGVSVRGRMAICPLHADLSPSLSLYKGQDGKERWRCHSCDVGGDAIDLEAAIKDMSIRDLFR